MRELDASGWAIGLAEGTRPVRDGVLCAVGGGEAQAGSCWFEGGHEADPLWGQACRLGVAAGPDGSGAGAAERHRVVATWPAESGGPRGTQNATLWYAVLWRDGSAWSEGEQRVLRLALRRMQAVWDYPTEAGLGRWLLGADGRVIHADAMTQAAWPVDEAPAPGWAAQAHEVIRQRWDAATDQRLYDMVVERGEAGDATRADWVRLCHGPAEGGLGGYDYVETRPIDATDAPPVGVVDDPRVGKALGYLIDHHAESPGLKEVAAEVESSPFHFHRLFSRVVGVSPKNFLLRTQLQMAKWRLRTGTVPVGDVAAASGFTSHGHFTATFHRVVGESPTDYRDRHAAEAPL